MRGVRAACMISMAGWRKNGEKGIINDITQKIAGVAYPNSLAFMTENPQF